MTMRGENLKRATEIEAMAEVATSQVEKDALLQAAQQLLADPANNSAEPRQGEARGHGAKPPRAWRDQ